MPELDIVQEQEAHEVVRAALEIYGSYVIEDRAIADVRDGLKPVQRRLLWAFWTLKRTSKAIPLKSATVAAETIGKYHPHGDSAAYQALVNLVWQRYGLAEGIGNFGNPCALMERAKNPADQRYTETRLTEFADRMFDDIEVATMVPSFTEEHVEPAVIPVRAPLLLVNGSQGIAMGLRATLPPHHLGEVIKATRALLRRPESTVSDLLKHLKGPDYGRGILLSRKAELVELYETGKGKLRYRCNYLIEEGHKRGTQRLIITGFAPGFQASKFEAETVKLRQQKRLVRAAYDDGSREHPTRVVVEFKDPLVVRDRLLPMLDTSVSYAFYALDENRQARLWSLTDLLSQWIHFRRQVERDVLLAQQADLQKKLGHEEARLAAVTKIDLLLKVLKKAKTRESLQRGVVKYLEVEPWQADLILKMPIAALRRSGRREVEATIESLQEKLGSVEDDLSHLNRVVDRRLKEMLAFVDKRGTRLRASGQDDLDVSLVHWVAVTPDGKVDRADKPPTTSRAAWKYVDLLPAKETVALVSDRNIGQSVSLSHLDKLSSDVGTIVGMATDRHSAVVVVTAKGKYIAFEPQQKRNSFPALKLEAGDSIVAAIGIREGDNVLVRRESGKLNRLSLDNEDTQNVKITRPNAKPKGIRGKGAVTHVWLEAHDEALHNGRRTLRTPKTIKDSEVLFRIGARNLVVQGTKRKVMSRKATLKTIAESAEDIVVVPVPKEDE